MKLFSSVNDISNLKEAVNQALMLKADPFGHQNLGKNKTLGLVFLNPSLRTRLSTQKAALNLGMNVMVMNLDKEGWALETEDGVVMNGTTVEHIREAAAVMGEYCDILGFRSFPKLQNREEDYSEGLFNKFVKFSGVPVISLESATLHPLQSFADLITIEEHKKIVKPKVVLTWAPHVKSLPQAVPNSFSEWMCRAQADGMLDFVITHPQGLELAEKFTSRYSRTILNINDIEKKHNSNYSTPRYVQAELKCMPKNRVYFEGTEIGKLSMIVINNESGEVSHIDFDRYGEILSENGIDKNQNCC